MNRDTYIWGAGHWGVLTALDFEKKDIKIKAFIDADARQIKTRLGLPVFEPCDVLSEHSDKPQVVIAVQNQKAIQEITRQLEDAGFRQHENFENSKFIEHTEQNSFTELWCQKEHEIKEYFLSLSTDTNDPEILEIIDWFKKGREPYMYPYEFSRKYHVSDIGVFFDEAVRLPFVMHGENKDKRMYFPEKWDVELIRTYYNWLRIEQDKDCPHCYEADGFVVQDGDVIADIGAAEGIYGLNYAEKAGKIYLFERDEKWIRALQETFKPYKEKVIIVNKYVSNINNDENVTLDSFFNGKRIDFIKADIEGMETQLLEGSSNILAGNVNLKLLLCAYHTKTDEMKIKEMLEGYGFKTEQSKGYMLWIWGTFRGGLERPYIRRGVVRAMKNI
jgi:hypothetical protein